ncbi:MAG: phosphoethanolamine transferase [Paludibacteraceae bacterium]|nr:phosphoethanolamine transferase [Paludibacteraceae bacterium]
MKQIHPYIRRTILFLLLLLPNIYAVFCVNDLTISLAKSIIYFVVVLTCLLLPALVLKAKAYFITEGLLTLLCAPIEIASIYINKETCSKPFLAIIYSTDRQEATELLSSMWFLVVAVLIVWAVYFYLAATEKQEWLLPKPLQKSLLILLPILPVCGMGVFSIFSYHFNREQTPAQIAADAADKIMMKFYKIFPYNFYVNSISLLRDERDIDKRIHQLEQFRFGISSRNDTLPEVVVLVIGETARSHNFSLNGYERPTTPLLSKRANIISYDSAYSQANLTAYAVPHILSRIPVIHRDCLYTERDMIDAFKEAGYSDAWITNQSAGTYTARHLHTTDYHYASHKGGSAEGNYDVELLTPLEQYLHTQTTAKKIICLHTMGNHWRYDSRYPIEFSVYQPTIDNKFNITDITPAAKEKLLNAYDNGILYTDFFLDSLINRLEMLQCPVIMLYLSDHGENIYDDEREVVLHGSYIGTRYEYNIPFILWYSEQYFSLHPDKVLQLRAHQHSQFNSAVVFHTLLDACGITEPIDSTMSLCHPAFCPMDTMQALTGDENFIKITCDTILR